MNWSEAWSMVLPAAGIACMVMIGLWAVQLRTRNAGIVDFGWAAILGSLALFYAAEGPGWEPRRLLLAAVGGLWGFRLALHLFRNRVWRQPEEGRYRTLRREWASPLDLSFLVFFEAQAILAVVLSLPFLLTAFNPAPGWMWTDVAGLLLWTGGWVGVSIADRQLEKWKEDPANRGKTCRRGLWRYTRHPNYFFEWVLWWGFAVLAVGTPGGWIAVLSPLLLLALILKVTGIPPTEAQALKSRGEDYREYQRTTSAFFPWFPKKEKAA